MMRVDFGNVINKVQRVNLNGSHLFKLMTKIQIVKRLASNNEKTREEMEQTRIWDIFAQLQKLEDDLRITQETLLTRYDQRIAKNTQGFFKEKKKQTSTFPKTFQNQRAKIKYLSLNGTNSGYFHKVAIGRRNRKFIKEIKITEGTIIGGEENIQTEIRADYKKRFRKEQMRSILDRYLSLINSKITENENEELTKPVSNEEI